MHFERTNTLNMPYSAQITQTSVGISVPRIRNFPMYAPLATRNSEGEPTNVKPAYGTPILTHKSHAGDTLL